VGNLLGMLDPEDGSTTVIQNVGNYRPNNIGLQPRRLQFSAAAAAAALEESQISQIWFV
jgi:hypothetical protein